MTHGSETNLLADPQRFETIQSLLEETDSLIELAERRNGSRPSALSMPRVRDNLRRLSELQSIDIGQTLRDFGFSASVKRGYFDHQRGTPTDRLLEKLRTDPEVDTAIRNLEKYVLEHRGTQKRVKSHFYSKELFALIDSFRAMCPNVSQSWLADNVLYCNYTSLLVARAQHR